MKQEEKEKKQNIKEAIDQWNLWSAKLMDRYKVNLHMNALGESYVMSLVAFEFIFHCRRQGLKMSSFYLNYYVCYIIIVQSEVQRHFSNFYVLSSASLIFLEIYIFKEKEISYFPKIIVLII